MHRLAILASLIASSGAVLGCSGQVKEPASFELPGSKGNAATAPGEGPAASGQEPSNAPHAGTSASGDDPSVGDDPPPDPGRITLHRLNRVEYANTVRDLLGASL